MGASESVVETTVAAARFAGAEFDFLKYFMSWPLTVRIALFTSVPVMNVAEVGTRFVIAVKRTCFE